VYKKEKQAIETFPDKKYMVVFVDKTRSDERDLQLLYYTDLKYNKWSELGYCSIQPQ
jgi:hypothetical protein